MRFWLWFGNHKVYADFDGTEWTAEFPVFTLILNRQMPAIIEDMKGRYTPIPELFIMNSINAALEQYSLKLEPETPFVITGEMPWLESTV